MSFSPPRTGVNYLYFGAFLMCIVGFSYFHYPSLGFPLSFFFFFHALGQALFEVSALVFGFLLLQQSAPRWAQNGFISISFVFLLVHYTDFTMIRILDASISYLFKMFFGNGLSHIITIFRSLNLNLAMIAICGAVLLSVPAAGIFLYRATDRLVAKKPWPLEPIGVCLFLSLIGISLCFLDVFARPCMSRLAYTKYQKALPFGRIFFPPAKERMSLSQPFALPGDETKLLERASVFSAPVLPNIYLFVIETLRKDFITSEVAPHLFEFGEANVSFARSFSNANSSPISWFSIFHASYPYHWSEVRSRPTRGSLPLQILKKLGYKIHVYSSADLHYFGMDKAIFGADRALPDSFEEYSLDLAPCDRDSLALQSFARDLRNNEWRAGNAFLFFLDTPHSEYRVPKDFPLKFEPTSGQIDYLTLTKEDIEPIKNQYRNALAYVDFLMGNFFETLQKQELYEDAIIAITGDHGEEFFEEGALFHGTHLNHIQTSVPIFCKFQDNKWPVQTDMATHMDLFPSILHYLTKQSEIGALFDGQSVFAKRAWPYRIAVLQNGPGVPEEFAIEGESSKIIARLINPATMYTQTNLEILSVEAPFPLPPGVSHEDLIADYFPDAFSPFSRKK